jgi:hypothetical protein
LRCVELRWRVGGDDSKLVAIGDDDLRGAPILSHVSYNSDESAVEVGEIADGESVTRESYNVKLTVASARAER